MRKLVWSLLFLPFAFLRAQDTTIVATARYVSDTLSTAKQDTVDVLLRSDLGANYVTVDVYTTTGDDTVKVYGRTVGDLLWTQRALIDLSAGTDVTELSVSTTPKSYAFIDPVPFAIRLTSADGVLSTVFVIGLR